jgi:hypothetical protein
MLINVIFCFQRHKIDYIVFDFLSQTEDFLNPVDLTLL